MIHHLASSNRGRHGYEGVLILYFRYEESYIYSRHGRTVVGHLGKVSLEANKLILLF